MHDIDRISMESPFSAYETDNEFGQYEGEFGEYQGEYGGQYEDSYEQQYEGEYAGESEADFEFGSTLYSESPFNEAQELARRRTRQDSFRCANIASTRPILT